MRHKHVCGMDDAARVVIWVLALVLFAIVLTACTLAFLAKPVPDELVRWGENILVAMVAMLAGTKRDKDPAQAQDVTVVNKGEAESIPVDPNPPVVQDPAWQGVKHEGKSKKG